MMKEQKDFLIGIIIILVFTFLVTIGINTIQSTVSFRFFEIFGILNIIIYTYILFNIDKFKK